MKRFSRTAAFVVALVLAGQAGSARAQPQCVNLAKYQPCAADSSAAGDPAVYATDGIAGNGNRWKSGDTGPHWLTVTLPLAMQVGGAHLWAHFCRTRMGGNFRPSPHV